jgi:hypothetical protein
MVSKQRDTPVIVVAWEWRSNRTRPREKWPLKLQAWLDASNGDVHRNASVIHDLEALWVRLHVTWRRACHRVLRSVMTRGFRRRWHARSAHVLPPSDSDPGDHNTIPLLCLSASLPLPCELCSLSQPTASTARSHGAATCL